jgi:hypothetical protein
MTKEEVLRKRLKEAEAASEEDYLTKKTIEYDITGIIPTGEEEANPWR